MPMRPGVVVPVPTDPRGTAGPTPGQARGPGWRRTAPGLYVPSSIDSTALDQRIVEAGTGLPENAAVTGWAVLAWAGAKWFDGVSRRGGVPLPVPIALHDRRRVRARRGVLLTEDWLFADDIVELDGLRVTTAVRAVTFEARRARSVEDAVRVIDLAAASDAVSLVELRAYSARLVSRPGVRRLRAALDLADENVWSPLEPSMRLAWWSARRCTLVCNTPVFDRSGRHLFTPDLLDPVAGVAGEYDGLVHLSDGVRRRDLGREDAYRDHGIELVTMLNSDLADRTAFHARLAAAYRRALPPYGDRSWTLEQPSWWVDTSSVERRRALSDDERRRWLRWQVA